jgi:proline-specific peptidase
MQLIFEGSVPLGDLNIFVRQYGSSNKNILFIHGGPDWDHSYFLPSVLPLSKDYKLTFFDLRGCGLSTKFGDNHKYSITQAAHDVGDLIARLQLDKIIVLGFSYGGRVLLEYLASKPKNVQSVILASSTAYTDFQNELDTWEDYNFRNTLEMKSEISNIFSSKISDEEKSKKLAFLTYPLDIWNLDKKDVWFTVLQKVKFSGEWMRAWQAGMLKPTNTNYEDILRASLLPVLILHGQYDMRFPVSLAKRLHDQIPNSKLAILKNSGHMAHIDETDSFIANIQSFLK